MTRHALAVPRCFVLVVLAAAGFAYGWIVLTAVTLLAPFPSAVAGQIRLAGLGRRLARDWAGADLPDVDRLPPPVPQRRADGWYVHANTLFKSPRIPAWMSRMDHYADDEEAGREWRWLMLAPFSSALPVLLPPALIVTGVLVLIFQPWPWSVLAALTAVTVAVLVAPAALRRYGQATQALLRRETVRTERKQRWIGRAWDATWQVAGLAGLSLAAFGAALLATVAVVLSLGGLLLSVTMLTRPLAEIYRRFAHRWTGVDLPSPYRPFPAPPPLGEDGTYRVGRGLYTERSDAVSMQRYGWISGDPATWRDQLWALGGLLLAPLSFVPAALVIFGFFGLVWQPLSWLPWGVPVGLASGYWVTPFWLWYAFEYAGVVPSSVPDWTSIPIGLAITALGLVSAVPVLRLRLRWDSALLRPTAATVLALRVAELRTSRTDVVDSQAAELRRIERDLHDGPQARLIAVGLGLGAVARLMETDPARARQLLAQAQDASATALTELRDLVRGIHPPVLAERGLADAVRAIALDTPLPVTVHADLPGRPEPPVESAVYFTACETLANAARVASHVTLTLSHHDGVLRMVVTDDGPGGADPARGTGLNGITQRLTSFDGTLTLHSPAGGPTVITVEVPCVLSSPRTSTC
ncbi:histidine kinase [Actinoplanes sp. NBC_00393]|uniref:sensor histidine kinase n=1 Tax=Actinoplanes sp. NBC_00393 TaxID=2975953 RepID=UPI002E228593